VGTALLPDAGVDSAFDEDGVGIVRGDADVAGEGGKRGVPGALPARVFAREYRCGVGVGMGWVREEGGSGGEGGEFEEGSAFDGA
jgi:hypothetical protein